MTRHTIWLGLVVLASQFAAGCCHHRCGWWRHGYAHCGTCAPAYAGPVASYGGGPSCPSCLYGPADPMAVPAGPPVVGPTVGPMHEVPQAMPIK